MTQQTLMNTTNPSASNLRKALNTAYLNTPITQEALEQFKLQATQLLTHLQYAEGEEFHKKNLVTFLEKTFYQDYYLNTKQKIDLVIHQDKTASSCVAVMLELKSPHNQAEMINRNQLNKKSLQELVLYYLRERITHKNLQLKHLIITNIREWFIFDAQIFERCFADNKTLVGLFSAFENNTLATQTTASFYQEIAAPAIVACQAELEFTYFNLQDYQTCLATTNPETDQQLIPLFKVLSAEHLLKLPLNNDNNRLNKAFYTELLYLIGLEEVQENSKKLIKRKITTERNLASIVEQIIHEIASLDKITHLPNPQQYGISLAEQLETVALELSITWINRLLFLKLLEAQLMTYHNHDKAYQFLNAEKISCFADLNRLFFQVLAIKPPQRNVQLQQAFPYVPYLNSSLFELTDLEDKTISISHLSRLNLPLLATSVLKNVQGQAKIRELDLLTYLFEFLDSYNFASDSKAIIQENHKALINAAVLGLIFEKINGYKDGSFFTPSAITQYMSRESLRLSLLQKFNETKNWNCQNFTDLYNQKKDLIEANAIINSLKVCDPAVGSGHFLVSILNEILVIKSELEVLLDRQGKRLNYRLVIVNGELNITHRDDDMQVFVYNQNNQESQRVQEALFHEKQTLIENCLFGVDINPNSVKICQLRLWIELLKNAYYINDGNEPRQLETLPNIDINIQVGDSLISRFPLDMDLKTALKRSQIQIEDYQQAFLRYQNAENKAEKQAMTAFIKTIKANFCAVAYENDPHKKLLAAKLAEKSELMNVSLIEETDKEKSLREKKLAKLELTLHKISEAIENFTHNPFYAKAFEWRFEFPQVLNADSDFVGFDIIIGNPPYISAVSMARTPEEKLYFKTQYPEANGAYDIYILFLLKALKMTAKNGVYAWIIPNKFKVADYAKNTQEKLRQNGLLSAIDVSIFNIFENASVYPILIFGKIASELPFRELYLENYADLELRQFKERQALRQYPSFAEQNILFASGATGFEAQTLKALITEKPSSQTLPFIVSGAIDRYTYTNTDIRFMGLQLKTAFMPFSENIAKSKWRFWNNEKIVIAGMTKVIEAVYATAPLALGVGVYAIYDYGGFNPYFLVALLNSRFLTHYLNLQAKDKHLASGYLAINKSTLEKLPLVKPETELENKIAEHSWQIHQLKQQNSKANTTDLEQEIDAWIYALYGLIPEEIASIENTKF